MESASPQRRHLLGGAANRTETAVDCGGAIAGVRRPVMIVVDKREACRKACNEARSSGSLGFVPTMGYLHGGHHALLEVGRRKTDVLVVSIFVNPTQFGPGEDLSSYPRNLEGDLDLCRRAGVDIVFTPSNGELYPPGFQTWVDVDEVTSLHCGASRDGHFRGVTTVVTKLFNIVRPDLAVFGEKDYQQLVTIRRMVEDLNMGIEIVGAPTVRESDGLAVSSRNTKLGPSARRRAACLIAGIRATQEAYARGERRADSLVSVCKAKIEADADEMDYVHLAEPLSLKPLEGDEDAAPETRIMVAAFLDSASGRVRLIDNEPLVAKRR